MELLTIYLDETMMTIHINANMSPVIKERVGMLHWVIDPEVSGFIIGYDLSGNQVLICNFDVCPKDIPDPYLGLYTDITAIL